jgi:membrane fusion protein (multidrug efflux system)
VETNKADIALIKAQINETELRAPFDGIIGLREVSEGAYVSPATKITKLSKVSPLKLEFALPERYVEILRNGMPVSFTMSGDTNVFKANVYAMDSKIDAATTSLMMRAHYPNIGGKIPPGRYASVKLELLALENGISVPAEAVVPEMGRQTVFLSHNGKAEQISVIPGLRTESSVQILSGLNVGDTVLTTGILQLRHGIPVVLDNVK